VANQLAFTPLEKISGIVPQVAFPAFSRLQSDAEAYALNFLKGLKLLNVLLIPSYIAIAILAPDIVDVLLGPRWQSIAEPMRILCLIMPLRALDILFVPGMNGLGKSHINALTSGISLLIMACSFLIGVRWGYVGLCWAWVIGFAVIYIFMVTICLRSLQMTLKSFFRSYKTAVICGIATTISSALLLSVLNGTINAVPRMLAIVFVSFFANVATIYWIDRPMIAEVKGILSRRKRPV
jgi:O-antigen/teichoic acid export membrane protein